MIGPALAFTLSVGMLLSTSCGLFIGLIADKGIAEEAVQRFPQQFNDERHSEI